MNKCSSGIHSVIMRKVEERITYETCFEERRRRTPEPSEESAAEMVVCRQNNGLWERFAIIPEWHTCEGLSLVQSFHNILVNVSVFSFC